MMPTTRIGLVGDFRQTVRAHGAIPKALALAAARVERDVTHEWLATEQLGALSPAALAERLAPFGALWCVPGSPYASTDGALAAIRFARERRVPFLGTCGGFQHAVLEYARDVLGMDRAEHAESSPGAEEPVLSSLMCPLVAVKAPITFAPGSRLATIYGVPSAVEEFQCSFGVNPAYRAALSREPLRFTAFDHEGDVRALELADTAHPFFVATLFQCELSALAPNAAAHPLVTAFVRCAPTA